MNTFFIFIESLKRACFRKKNLILLLATIIVGGFVFYLLASAPEVSACCCHYHVVFNGRTIDSQNDTSTWSYTVSSEGRCPDISHWVWQPCYSLEELEQFFVEADPEDELGLDGSTKHYGIKWEEGSDFNWDEDGVTFTITIEGQPEIDNEGAIAAVKAGNLGDSHNGSQNHLDFIIAGPSCALPPEPYCGDGNLDPGEECEVGHESCFCGGICNLETCLCEEPEPEPINIFAYKVVCEKEEYLPNWGDGVSGPSQITVDTAQNYVDNSQEKCWLESDWEFQWGPEGQKQTGNYVGAAPAGTGWTDFDTSTGVSGAPAEAEITGLAPDTPKIWVRENLKEGYVPFTYPPKAPTEDNVSAEMWCHDDILNYDNYDYIRNPEAGTTYYCVAFNALVEEPGPVCGNGILELGEECEVGYEDCGCGYLCNLQICLCEEEAPQPPICGNGILEAGEECDDGNTEPDDGCSVNCTIEVPTECDPGETRACDTGQLGICAQGTQTCSLEGEWGECIQDNQATDEICNNGLDDNCDGFTDCDDEGCIGNPFCEEPGPECEPGEQKACDTGELGICAQGVQTCDQDGYWDECVQIYQPFAEVCDDGLDNDCDGLVDCDDIDCEQDPYCEPAPQPYCGDSNLDPGEDCDDGVNNGIPCVPPYGSSCNYCSNECEIVGNQNYSFCGDGVLDEPYEECDDGNNEPSDGCSAACLIEEPECEPGAEKPCDTGNLGICAQGTQTCNQDGFWGICVQDEQPISEICNNGLDDDCDGDTDCDDESCEEHPFCEEEPGPPTCTPGNMRSCGTGNPGICASGTQTCNSQGFWGVCVQNEQPTMEICNNGLDDDCDGSADCGDSDCAGSIHCYVAPPGPSCTDADGDGYYSISSIYCSGNDCNDGDAAINPGAAEICTDGIDNDCDGDIDCDDSECGDSPLCGYGGPVCTDLDLDGYAVEGAGCGPVDCNDGEFNINPGASEICTDGIDNDCDGDVDCDDSDCSTQPICSGYGGPMCTDSDLDGYNVEGGECGLVDCDDGQASVNPGASEICTDEIDNDCDGNIDCADIDCARDSACKVGPPPECNPGDQRLCDTGLLGVCADGVQICGEDSLWTDCTSIDQPVIESCDNGLDDDCDGLADCADDECRDVLSCGEGGGEEEEEEESTISRVRNSINNLLAAIGSFVGGVLPSCLPWWLIIIFVIYALWKAMRSRKERKKESRFWLAWAVVLIIFMVFLYINAYTCLNWWIFLILLLITFLIRCFVGEKKEEE